MAADLVQAAEAFSRHDFTETEPFLAADVRWNVVSADTIEGRDAVLRVCAQTSGSLASTTTTFTHVRVLSGDDHAVVDTVAEYLDPDGTRSVVASCDIYLFAGGLVSEITSYNVELG